MSESTSAAGRAGLSLLDAARVLGVSEKTLRRRIKAGEVEAEKVALDSGGLEWRVYLDSVPEVAPDSVPVTVASVPEVVPVINERAGSETDNATDVPEAQRPTVPDSSETRAGTVPEVLPDTLQSTFTAHLLEENRFLRLALEARDRDAAELRAALREALKLSNRALPQSTLDTAPTIAPEAPQSAQSVSRVVSSGEVESAPQRPPEQSGQGTQSTFERTRGFRAWLLKVLRG
jgi:hypothetical protein